MGVKVPKAVNMKEKSFAQRRKDAKKNYCFPLRLCAFAGDNFCEFTTRRYKLTVKSRVRANVMGQKTPYNLENLIRLYGLIKDAIRRGFRV
jgi:hypothetical protein